MVQVVNKSQQVVTSGLSPRSAYSRVIALHCRTAPGVDTESQAWTPAIGNDTWLLGVDVWLMSEHVDVLMDGYVYLRTGQGEPALPVDMINQWAPIIPVYWGDVNGFEHVGHDGHYHWNMNRLFTGTERKMGIVLHNLSAIVPMRAIVSFEISEG